MLEKEILLKLYQNVEMGIVGIEAIEDKIESRSLAKLILNQKKEYEALKVSLALQAPAENGREKYLKGKHDFIVYTLRKALVKSYLGKTVDIKIDRPIGSIPPARPGLPYPVNYGHIPHVLGGDGEELDVYLLGVEVPVEEYTARIIGIVHRRNDVEDKLVAAPEGFHYNPKKISEAVRFQEQYYESEIEIYKSPRFPE